jgi:NAD(P)-dependent dehydrogenase (short-subunit alcohol dehydrogenase family)
MAKTWFITGASRGLGAVIARQALERGDNVVATARAPEAVTQTLGERPNLLAVALDVTNEKQAIAAAEAAVERFGRIDVLINNAGFGLLGAVEEVTALEVERVYATNVFGLLAVTRAVLPHMRRQRSGHILNMSSLGGYAASAGWGSTAQRNSRSKGSRRHSPSNSSLSAFMRRSSSQAFSGPIFSTPARCPSALQKLTTTRTR